MLDSLLRLIAPHSCVSCARAGAIMCSACRHELAENRTDECIACGRDTDVTGMCASCKTALLFDSARIFTRRVGSVEKLINDYKFARTREAYRPLAAMIASVLPRGTRYVVVPVPTVRAHVRQRGYDHAALLAKRVARLNGSRYATVLRRRTRTVQHGADKRTRAVQAAAAFAVHGRIDPAVTYVILDDIVTTGASLAACARALRSAGARTVIAAAVARQPLDDAS